MKFILKYIVAIISVALFNSCETAEIEVTNPYPDDITFNEMALDRFAFKKYDAPFNAGNDASGIITVNAGLGDNTTHKGFALSNKNNRSYPWYTSPKFAPKNLTEVQKQAVIDSSAYSVLTFLPNGTENFLVGNTSGDNAFFTLAKPGVVEHVLVANTSYNYLLTLYGSVYSKSINTTTQAYLITGAEVQNPFILNTSTDRYGTFRLPAPGDFEALRLSAVEIFAKRAYGEIARAAALAEGKTTSQAATAYSTAYAAYGVGNVKLTMEGYLNGNKTGEVSEYLALQPKADPANPLFNFVLNDWKKVDLTSLGTVDKVLFKMSSNYVDAQGKMRYPTLFCLDGIRLKK